MFKQIAKIFKRKVPRKIGSFDIDKGLDSAHGIKKHLCKIFKHKIENVTVDVGDGYVSYGEKCVRCGERPKK